MYLSTLNFASDALNLETSTPFIETPELIFWLKVLYTTKTKIAAIIIVTKISSKVLKVESGVLDFTS